MSGKSPPLFIAGTNEFDADTMNHSNAQDTVRDATAAFNAGQPDKARQLCEDGLTRQPGEPMLHHLLAAVLFSKGDIQAARTHVETSLASRPDHAAALLLAARIARAARDFDGALSHLDRTIAIAPGREVFLEKARTLDQAGHRSHASKAWRAILEAIPQHPEAAARLGRFAWEDGDTTTAATLLECALGGDPPASVWFDLGLVRHDLRDWDGAAAAYRKVLDIKPDHAEAALNLGVVLQDAGDLDGAMRAYVKAYRLRPSAFGAIAMALTSAPHGRLWLDDESLRRSLGG